MTNYKLHPCGPEAKNNLVLGPNLEYVPKQAEKNNITD